MGERGECRRICALEEIRVILFLFFQPSVLVICFKLADASFGEKKGGASLFAL